MVIVDVGANIGYYALLFAHHVGPRGYIYCIEPDPTNLIELRANVAENSLERIVTVIPTAAGAYDGMTRFEPGLNSHVVPQGSVEISVRKVDSLIPYKVDLIKIDVEGYEGAVLVGASATINQFRPVLLVELHPNLLTGDTHAEIIHMLEQHYSSVRAYQIKRGKAFSRFLQSYGLTDELREITDLGEIAEGYKRGRYAEPCWIVARA